MSAPSDQPPGDSESADARAVRLRWLARAVVFAIGLWFVFDGLSGLWPGLDFVARAMIVLAVLLGVAFAVLGLLHLARRGREG